MNIRSLSSSFTVLHHQHPVSHHESSEVELHEYLYWIEKRHMRERYRAHREFECIYGRYVSSTIPKVAVKLLSICRSIAASRIHTVPHPRLLCRKNLLCNPFLLPQNTTFVLTPNGFMDSYLYIVKPAFRQDFLLLGFSHLANRKPFPYPSSISRNDCG